MQKRAVSKMLGILIEILIGIIILFVVLSVSTDIFSILRLEKKDDSSFGDLITAIKDAKDEEQEVIYYVSKSHFLVGFGGKDEAINDARKPRLQCGNYACICKCNLKDSKIMYDGCYNAECEVFKGIEDIEGITLLSEDIKSAEIGKLLIKGRIELPLKIKRENNRLIITTPMQK